MTTSEVAYASGRVILGWFGSFCRATALRRRGATVGRKVWIEGGFRVLGSPAGLTLGDNVVIRRGSSITLSAEGGGASLSVGPATFIGENCHIVAHGEMSLGTGVLLAANVYVSGANHGSAYGQAIRHQPLVPSPVTICDDVWLGANAVVLPGVTVNAGCIVGAGAVVTKSLPADSVAVGNPARIIRSRSQ